MPEKTKAEIWIPIIIAFLTLTAGGGWGKVYFDHHVKTEQRNEELRVEYLAKVKTLLETNKSIKDRIYRDYREGNWGILESYVEKVKKGEDKVAILLMANDIATIKRNNEEVISLLTDYSGNTLTNEFKEAIPLYIGHAQNWVHRAENLSAVVETGQQYPYAEPFPGQFISALSAEIVARDGT